ncbi:hypothetical protein [Moorella sp. E308F]|uniref:hypothetical protein n=1 Tax=Moorella sp. E308F TaxID=2572682 RepID=UPI001141D935|nr:hypothetical protein [Moorella sp. E308F]
MPDFLVRELLIIIFSFYAFTMLATVVVFLGIWWAKKKLNLWITPPGLPNQIKRGDDNYG